ncbi:hypothetical protein [Oceanobacillus neutriphilus]|uniref:Uncharacterized protein n=1 Tax=Oceanobacillus neutriphilus TaxID=531815 RepID=A0ABQ2NS85_9BACI|nr:hypothetical protein [Oceanobacillus neutriphilus]GGP08390.1 hypothetical protein GCM10011346_08240 [Oceanobacillus neutriphilus]
MNQMKVYWLKLLRIFQSSEENDTCGKRKEIILSAGSALESYHEIILSKLQMRNMFTVSYFGTAGKFITVQNQQSTVSVSQEVIKK